MLLSQHGQSQMYTTAVVSSSSTVLQGLTYLILNQVMFYPAIALIQVNA